ncbi:2'-5' RNA ligase [Marmoricola sp. OAE513]|uniref:2'-5' RNA ligase family protein n=1 Tax=Marmoricola sp. OAE513 TaxID=2817894 RepID=UPI001AE16C2F
MTRAAGHSVIVVPVPELDEVVRERTAFYDPSFVSTDPRFVHAHLTVLGPWVAKPSMADMARLAAIARATPAFEVELAEIGEFPDGLLSLLPEPDTSLRSLTAWVAAAFPDHPPYGGKFKDPVPHLTLDQRGADVTPESVLARVAHLLPLTVTVDRLDVQWWENDGCRVLGSVPLGEPA